MGPYDDVREESQDRMAKKGVKFEVELKRPRSLTSREEKGRDGWGISTKLAMELSVRR